MECIVDDPYIFLMEDDDGCIVCTYYFIKNSFDSLQTGLFKLVHFSQNKLLVFYMSEYGISARNLVLLY